MAPRPARRRLLLAGALTGLALTAGAGAAYAATSADGEQTDPGPSGYAVVVDAPGTTGPSCPFTDQTPGADA